MRLIFEYTRADDDYRPLVPITLTYKGNTKPFRALIDTGADRNVIPTEVAEFIGVNWKRHGRGLFKREEIHSFTGSTNTIIVPMDVTITQKPESITQKNVEFNTSIDRKKKFHILLGRPFLSDFVITFDGPQKVFIIETKEE